MSRLTGAALPALRLLLASSPTAGYLGLRAELIDSELVVVLPGSDRHVGDSVRRSVHGGILAAYLEAAAAAALAVERGGDIAALGFTTAFVRPAAVADTFASVDIVRTGRRIAHVRVDAWQTDRASLVSTGQGTFASG